MADKDISRKKRKTILSILACLLLVFFLGLFLLPNMIATDWAGKKVKQAVNVRIPGTLDFEKLSLSWIGGLQCQNVTYRNTEQGLMVKVADVSTSKGLLPLVFNYKEIGEISVKEPVANIYLPEKPPSEGTSDQGDSGKQGDKSGERGEVAGSSRGEDSRENGSPTTFPSIEGRLLISGGAVNAVSPDGKERRVLKDLELQLNVAGLENLVQYLISFQSGDNMGQVKGVGTVRLPEDNISRLDKIQSQGTLDINNWEIKDVLSILGSVTDIPTGSGLLNGHLSISGSQETKVQIKGNLAARQVKLHGGLLQTDSPSLESVSVELDAEKTPSTFILNRLVLTSPLASGTASGVLGAENKKELISQAVIDLAELFTQFPGTLKLQPGIKVSSGTIDLNAKITATGKATFFDGNARLDKLHGVADGKYLSWDKPVTLAARGEQNRDGIRLGNFEIKSSFLNGKGQGDINQMELHLAADIGAALKEMEKFIKLEEWKSSGKMDLDLQLDTKTKALRSVAGSVTIREFFLHKKEKVIAPSGVFKASLSTDLRLDQEMRPLEILDSVLGFQSWIGNGDVSLKSFVPAVGQAGIQLKDLGFKGALDLEPLTTLFNGLGMLPADTRLVGRANVDTQLSIKDDKLDLDHITLDSSQFLFQKGKQKFSEKKIHLTTLGSVDLNGKSVTFGVIDLQTDTGRMTLPELIVTDWSKLENSIKTKGSIDLDLGSLITLLAGIQKLPADITAAGKAALKFDVDLNDAQQQLIKMDGTLKPVTITSKKRPLLSEDSIRLAVDLKGNVRQQNFTLRSLELSTVPVSLTASGKIVPDDKERLLTSEGSIALDLNAISDYLQTLTDVKIEMSGATQRPFTLRARSTQGQWLKLSQNTEFSTSFHADSIKGFGLHIQSLEIPLRLAHSVAVVDIQGLVNRGKVALKPAIDFTVEPPLISIPENNAILAGVGMNDEMSKDLLVKIHPIFKGAAVSQGTVDLGLQRFSWPLDAAARKDAAFAGSLTFKDVKLQAGGLLAPLLALMKVEQREITLDGQSMEFVGENERVRCSPLDIKIKDYSLRLAGSIGFDQSLDYVAQVPVTRNMVSSDVYKYLQGTFISVPIGGTVSRPAVGKNVVQTALKDLIIQAGKKQLSEQAGKLLQNLFK